MDKMQMLVEALEIKRTKWIKINLIGFIVWDGTRILRTYLLTDQSSQFLVVLELIGSIIWIISLVRLLRLLKK